MQPLSSIRERRKAYTLRHFNNSKYAKMLKQFYNIHVGEACFIIGNGPSLQAEDLELIHRRKLPSFGFNRIYLLFNKTAWRPTYYISQDELTLKNCVNQVNAMQLDYKFIPLFIYFYHNIVIDNAFYFNLKASETDIPLMSDDIASYIGDTNTVAVTAAQMAVYMGFKKIYLIGVDHSFSTYQNDKGEIIQNDSIKDYFTDEYNKDKADLAIPNLDKSTRAFISMKKFCDEKGIEVYNATRGGKLEVFPRVDFDEVINNI